ncbi:hypothetical protein JKG47_08985 [Acidithiobacillus sp. MC6.1]|nr:hypothetical protein [Acidithiobacillus sp. MC6.1]
MWRRIKNVDGVRFPVDDIERRATEKDVQSACGDYRAFVDYALYDSGEGADRQAAGAFRDFPLRLFPRRCRVTCQCPKFRSEVLRRSADVIRQRVQTCPSAGRGYGMAADDFDEVDARARGRDLLVDLSAEQSLVQEVCVLFATLGPPHRPLAA